MFRVSEEWIRRYQSGGGGWNQAQLECIGVKWPPEHGWISRAVGREISDAERARFEFLQGRTRKFLRTESQQALFPTEPADNTGPRSR